ncbi:MAG: orotidine-5'-phosphate decarboxylase [Thermodesulfobacteriota bacterium]
MMSKLNLKPEERIILALDFPELKEATSWVERLRGKIKTFKVGPILFLNSGPQGIISLSDMGAQIFLDLKFHDIPSTAEKSAKQVVGYGISMFTVHALGGFEMMRAVSESVKAESERLSQPKPLILAVTILTSHGEGEIDELGIKGLPIESVLRLADIADVAGMDGIVCSGMEVEVLKKEFGDRFKFVVPGIRLDKYAQDQKRVVTPAEAVSLGADYIVIGRAITGAKNPEEVVNEIILSITQTVSN